MNNPFNIISNLTSNIELYITSNTISSNGTDSSLQSTINVFYKLCCVGNIPTLIECIKMGINMEPIENNNVLYNGIKNAVLHRQYSIIKIFLEDYNIPAQYIYDIGIRELAYTNNIKIIRLLIKHGADPITHDYYIFKICCSNGWSNLLNTLVNDYTIDIEQYPTLIKRAIIDCHINILNILIYKCNIIPTIAHFKLAIDSHIIKVVKYFIEMKYFELNKLFYYAITSTNYEVEVIVQLFIDKVDVCADNNKAIQLASSTNNVKILELILQNIDVDPTVLNNTPLCNAVKLGLYSNVKLLLSLVNRPVDPTVNNYFPLRVAIDNYNNYNDPVDYDIILLLSNDYRMNRSIVVLLMQTINMIDNEIPPLIPMEELTYIS